MYRYTETRVSSGGRVSCNYLWNRTQLMSLANFLYSVTTPVFTDEETGAHGISVTCPWSLSEQEPAGSGIRIQTRSLPPHSSSLPTFSCVLSFQNRASSVLGRPRVFVPPGENEEKKSKRSELFIKLAVFLLKVLSFYFLGHCICSTFIYLW